MAFKQSYNVVVFVLIFGQMISLTSADYDDKRHGPCPDVSMSKDCRINADCSTITCSCSTDFPRYRETFKLKVNKCDTPVSVTASMTVQDLGMSWSDTYTSDFIIKIPNCTVLLAGFYCVGVGLSDKGSTINLKVNCLASGGALEENVYLWKFTVIDGDLPISTDDRGIFGWWYDLSGAVQAAVISGSILFIIVLTISCTSVITSSVPMRPLVEEV